jgi:hypothetical protein
MSVIDERRTEAIDEEIAVDPHDRFAGHLDGDVGDRVESCSRCGSERLDGWITEGATSLWSRCVECGAAREEEIGR